MTRAHDAVVLVSALLAGSVTAFTPKGLAQTCESARPTDAQGTQGMTYGAADVSFLDAESGPVRVHYALSGAHAPPATSTLQAGVPDAVVLAAEAAGTALAKFVELSYTTPLSDADSPCSSNGGSDAVDVYLMHFAAADGQAALDHCQPGPPKRCAGFVLVENDFRGGGYADLAEGMRTVVPHELFHLVQNAYDADVERWWAEGTAEWAAKQVYPELRDLERFLPAYFKSPWRPLNVPPTGVVAEFLYATGIWPVFLTERFDASLVREVYEALGQGPEGVLPTTDVVLQARGTSLAREFLQFAAYNAATGDRAPDAGGYADAASYPLVTLEPLATAEGELVSEVASGLGAFYYSLRADQPRKLELQADRARVAALLVPLIGGKLELELAELLPATLEGEAVVVVAGQSLLRTDAPFTLEGKPVSARESDAASSDSGCSLARIPTPSASRGSAALAFVAMLLGRCRARTRKGR